MKRKVIEPMPRSTGFDLEDSTRRAMTHYRNFAQGRGGEVDVGKAAYQRARLAKPQATLVETKQPKLAGKLVDAADVESAWSGVLRTVRAGVLAVPSRCAQRLPHLTPHDVGAIEAEIREVLAGIAAESLALIRLER